MSDLTLKMLLFGEDRTASKALGGVGAAADKTGGKLAAMGKVAGIGLAAVAGAAGLGIAAIFKTGIDEQKDFLSGQAQLQAGIKSTGGAAGVTVNHMEDLASSIQGVSGQTDDSIVAAEKLLLTFTNIKNKGPDKIFDQTAQAAADMAARMGGDASSKAVLLGKALNNPVKGLTALTRVGVAFTDAQKKQIAQMVKTGDTVGAQKVILGELSKEFGGSAKAAGQTLPGQLARARRSFEDISQSVLQALMPVLVKLGDILVKYVIPALGHVVSWVVAHWPAFQAVIVDAWNKYIYPALQKMVGYFNQYVIPTVSAVVSYIVQHWPQIQSALLAFWQTVQPILLAFGNLLKTLWTTVLSPLVDWVKAHWAEISTAIKIAFAIIAISFKLSALIITGAINAIILAVRGIAAVITWLYSNVWKPQIDLIIGAVKGIVGAVKTVVSGVRTQFDTMVGFVTSFPGKIAKAAAHMWDGIAGGFKAAINWIIDRWNGLQFSIPGVDTHIPGVGTVGGFTLGTPDIPHLAAGGIVTRPTIGLMGEAGAEAIIPLNRANKNGFGGGNITVNVYPRTNDPREIANAVITAVRSQGMKLPIGRGITQ